MSITAQCIEMQLIPNKRLGKDLQIMSGHFHVRLLLRGVICVIKSQPESKCSSYILSFFLVSFHQPPFGQQLLYCTGKTSDKISGNFTCILMSRERSVLQHIVGLTDDFDLLRS